MPNWAFLRGAYLALCKGWPFVEVILSSIEYGRSCWVCRAWSRLELDSLRVSLSGSIQSLILLSIKLVSSIVFVRYGIWCEVSFLACEIDLVLTINTIIAWLRCMLKCLRLSEITSCKMFSSRRLVRLRSRSASSSFSWAFTRATSGCYFFCFIGLLAAWPWDFYSIPLLRGNLNTANLHQCWCSLLKAANNPLCCVWASMPETDPSSRVYGAVSRHLFLMVGGELDRLPIVLTQIINRHHPLTRSASISLLLVRHLLIKLPPLLGLCKFFLIIKIWFKLHELLL